MSTKIPVDNSQVQNADTQKQITPQVALQLLINGNERFVNGEALERNYEEQISGTAGGQWPYAVVLSCIDSRVPNSIIFDQGIGDIFDACVAGNFVNDDILGSMEYACAVAKTTLVVVLGHTGCGAVKGACDHVELGNITQMLDKIMPAVNATSTQAGEERNSKNTDFVNRVINKNVEMTMDNIRNRSAVLRDLENAGTINIVGGVYDVGSGKVHFS